MHEARWSREKNAASNKRTISNQLRAAISIALHGYGIERHCSSCLRCRSRLWDGSSGTHRAFCDSKVESNGTCRAFCVSAVDSRSSGTCRAFCGWQELIRRPLLARGTKAACLGTVAFLTISGHANQLSGYAFISLEGSNRDQIRPASSRSQDPFASVKIILFSKYVSKAQKMRKAVRKSTSKLFKPDFREKSIFAILSLRKP